jgi:hypothetical protein
MPSMLGCLVVFLLLLGVVSGCGLGLGLLLRAEHRGPLGTNTSAHDWLPLLCVYHTPCRAPGHVLYIGRRNPDG